MREYLIPQNHVHTNGYAYKYPHPNFLLLNKNKDLPAHSTPILIVAFNRPEKLAAVLETIAPTTTGKIYISYDGPRSDHEDDVVLINKCRQIALQCSSTNAISIAENFENINLGCRDHVIKAITWFYNNEEQGIILEDDCLPSSSFLRYCEELLKRYKTDERILMISGNNFGKNLLVHSYSYSFTRYISIWGWATWKNRWQRFLQFYHWLQHAEADRLTLLSETIQTNLSSAEEGADRFLKMKKALNGEIDSWGYLLSAYSLSNHLLTIVPNVNLISNTGFGENSTHTSDQNSWMSRIDHHQLQFPLNHPPFPVMSLQYHQSYQPELRNKQNRSVLHRIISKWN